MIQKISFGSKYTVTNYPGNKYAFSNVTATSSLTRDALYDLKDGDKICLSREGEDYSIRVPDYLDKKIERNCLYQGFEYVKK